jgi:hypothetical protein
MDKKTKLWLGVGVVGVGAYLLFKSKKAAAATPPVTKSLVSLTGGVMSDSEKFTNLGGPEGERMKNMINTLNSPTQKYSQDGSVFASVHPRQISQDGSLNGNSLAVKGGHAGVKGQGIFVNQPFVNRPDTMLNSEGGWNPFRRKKKGSVEIGPLEGSFEPLGTRTGSIEIGELTGEFVNQSGKFFYPKTARYGQNQGVFAPSNPKKSPVEPNRPMPVTQEKPLNNMLGGDGSKGVFFQVTDGKFVNR